MRPPPALAHASLLPKPSAQILWRAVATDDVQFFRTILRPAALPPARGSVWFCDDVGLNRINSRIFGWLRQHQRRPVVEGVEVRAEEGVKVRAEGGEATTGEGIGRGGVEVKGVQQRV